MRFIEEKFVPLAARIGSQKHLVAIRDSFAMVMPLTMAGGIAVLLNNFQKLFREDGLDIPSIYNSYTEFLNTSGLGKLFDAVNNGSNNILAILVVACVAYYLAKSNKGNGMASAIIAMGAYLGLAPIITAVAEDGTSTNGIASSVFGATGLFVGMLVGIAVGEIFPRLAKQKALIITMPDGVPPAVAAAFTNMLPAIITVFLICGVGIYIEKFTQMNIWELINMIVAMPLTSVSQSVWTVVIAMFLTGLLWTFGLHGGNIVSSVINPVLTPLGLENVAQYAAGQEPQYTVVSGLWSGFAYLGGSGGTIGLLIAILLFSKSKASRTVAQLSLAPGIFEINEPAVFGVPIVMNPIYMIPFVLGPVVLGVITYFLMEGGLLRRPCILAPWVTPPILYGFLCTGGDIRGAIWNAIAVVFLTILYTPFVMINDRIQNKTA